MVTEIINFSFFSFFFAESGGGDVAATSTTTTSPTKADNNALGDGTQVVFGDELMPSECLVKLESLATAGSKKQPLFVVHAIEGFVTALKPLAAKLTVPVYGLQCTVDAPLTSLADLAKFYVTQIKTVQKTGPYTIAGYSFGASVAFEMVSFLEAVGEKATLVMLDGSPKYVSWYTETHKSRVEGGSTLAQDEAYSLAYFGMVLANLDYVKTAKELEALATFEDRLQRVAELISQLTKYPADIVKVTTLTFYKKLLAAHTYKPERKVTSNVTLIKPTENYVKLSTDYGLSEVNIFFYEHLIGWSQMIVGTNSHFIFYLSFLELRKQSRHCYSER